MSYSLNLKLFLFILSICLRINAIVKLNQFVLFLVMNSEPSTSRGNKLTIIPSQRGGQILLCNGYKYNLRGNNNGHTTWRCVMRKCCSAKLVVNYNSIIIKEEPHTCKPDKAGNEVKEKMNTCLQRVRNETTPIPTIYSDIKKIKKFLLLII